LAVVLRAVEGARDPDMRNLEIAELASGVDLRRDVSPTLVTIRKRVQINCGQRRSPSLCSLGMATSLLAAHRKMFTSAKIGMAEKWSRPDGLVLEQLPHKLPYGDG